MCADPEVDQLIAKVDPQLWAHHFVLERPLNSETPHSRVLHGQAIPLNTSPPWAS